jgi:hypothetical protein
VAFGDTTGIPNGDINVAAAADVHNAPVSQIFVVRERAAFDVVVGFVKNLQLRRYVFRRDCGDDGRLHLIGLQTLLNRNNQAILEEDRLDDDALLHD